MPKRTNIRSILTIGLTAAMLATSASAEVIRTEDGPGPMDSHYLFEKFAGMMG